VFSRLKIAPVFNRGATKLLVCSLILISPLFFVDLPPQKREKFFQLKPLHFLQKNQKNDFSLNLNFSPGDMRHFYRLQQLVETERWNDYVAENVWRKVAIGFDDRVYAAKIKMHGLAPTGHSAGEFVNSFNVKLERSSTIFGLTDFKLIVAERFLFGLTTMRLGESLGVYSLPSLPVSVNFNDHIKYNYVFTSAASDLWAELSGRNTLLFFEESIRNKGDRRLKSFLFDEESDVWEESRIDELERMLSLAIERKHLPTDLSADILQQHRRLNRDIFYNNHKNFTNYFDVEYVANFFVALIATGEVGHLGIVGNQKVGYDTSNGLFYPVLHWDAATQPKFRPPVEKWGTIRSHTFFRKRAGSIRRNPLYSFILQHDDTRHRIINKLTALLSQPERLKPLFDLNKEYLTFSSNDLPELHWRIKDEISKIELEVSHFQKGGNLYVLVEGKSLNPISLKAINLDICMDSRSRSGVEADKINPSECEREVKVEHDVLYSTFAYSNSDDPLDKYTLVEKGFSEVVLVGSAKMISAPSSTIHVTFSANGSKISKTSKLLEVNLPETTFNDNQNKDVGNSTNNSWINEFRRYGTIIETENLSAFRFFQSPPPIDVDLLFPKGLKIVVPEGADIKIAQNKSLVFRGDIEFLGSEQKPIKFGPVTPGKPFGVIAGVVANGKATIQHTLISQPSEAVLRGMNLSGGLSLYGYSTSKLENIEVIDSFGEDAVNIKYGDLCALENIKITNAFFDGLDVDFCQIRANGIFISADGKIRGANGDGIDVSGTTGTIENFSISGFADKGISVGENSKIRIKKGLVKENLLGVAIKDGSCALLSNFLFQQNQTDIKAYNKKRGYEIGEYKTLPNVLDFNDEAFDDENGNKNDGWENFCERRDKISVFK
jgi:hypothetical protein